MSQMLYSWGCFPYYPQRPEACMWRGETESLLSHMVALHSSTLAYGNGRSYGDSCLALSDHVINMRGLDKFIEVDWTLGTITAEAGVTLSEILALAIPHGWFLAVTPGTQFVTLGGAVANDVHGKNHHRRGTFGNHVLSFGLLRFNEGEMTCTPTQNSELYKASISGLGLTGIITWVKIQLMPIVSSQIDTVKVRFNNLSEFFDLSSELDPKHEYSVAWIDCLATGNKTGRGVFIVGDHSVYGALEVPHTKKLVVPIKTPVSLINKFSLAAFNEIYWRRQPASRQLKRENYDPFFYPLDRILYWNRIYGRRGFQQYQCVIPDLIGREVMHEILSAISAFGQGSFLAVLKRCGDITSPGLLSFPMPGVSLALDFPQNVKLDILFSKLDRIVDEAKGRLYPAKDAHMSAINFRRAYPGWEQLETLRDPALNSHFWKRVNS